MGCAVAEQLVQLDRSSFPNPVRHDATLLYTPLYTLLYTLPTVYLHTAVYSLSFAIVPVIVLPITVAVARLQLPVPRRPLP